MVWRGGFGLLRNLAVRADRAWIIPPDHSFRIADPQYAVRLILFAFLACLISYLHYARAASREITEGK